MHLRMFSIIIGALLGWYFDDFVRWVKGQRRIKRTPKKRRGCRTAPPLRE